MSKKFNHRATEKGWPRRPGYHFGVHATCRRFHIARLVGHLMGFELCSIDKSMHNKAATSRTHSKLVARPSRPALLCGSVAKFLRAKEFFVILTMFLVTFQSISATPPSFIKDPDAMIGNEIARLDTLIQATELSLEGQKKLRTQIVEYQKLQDQYLKNSKDNELLLKLVKSAYRTLQTIKENNLIHTFDNEFIDELTIISQPATKRGIPKP